MSPQGATGWVLEWHDAESGKTRTVELSRHRVAGLIAALAFSGSALLASGIVAEAGRARTRAGIAAARNLNESLRARRARLEVRAVELGVRSASPESAPSDDRAPHAPE